MIEKTKKSLRIYIILSMASILIFIIGGILLLLYYSTEKSITFRMERILQENTLGENFMDNKGLARIDDGNLNGNLPIDHKFNFLFDQGRDLNKQPFFYLEVLDNEIINFRAFDFMAVESSFEIIEPYMETIISKSSGKIKINDSYYAFSSKEEDGYTAYALLDISMNYYSFINFLYIGLIILLLSLIFITFISFKLTNKTLTPLNLSIENQKRFSSDASHELRTPLASIRSNLDILTSYGDQLTEEEKTTWLQNISKEIERMTKLTSDLLLVSRDVQLNNEDYMTFSAEQLVCGLEFIYNDKILPVNSKVSFYHDDTEFFGIENEFKQLIIIFIDNGLKYNNKEEKEVIISISNKDKYNQIVIRDNGAGIKEENYDKIFERFFRNDVSRSNNQGFGLGLSIAKRIIEKYNGTIKVKSNFGEYAEFKINIPIKRI